MGHWYSCFEFRVTPVPDFNAWVYDDHQVHPLVIHLSNILVVWNQPATVLSITGDRSNPSPVPEEYVKFYQCRLCRFHVSWPLPRSKIDRNIEHFSNEDVKMASMPFINVQRKVFNTLGNINVLLHFWIWQQSFSRKDQMFLSWYCCIN